jgi:ammonia channel protein AmtB
VLVGFGARGAIAAVPFKTIAGASASVRCLIGATLIAVGWYLFNQSKGHVKKKNKE